MNKLGTTASIYAASMYWRQAYSNSPTHNQKAEKNAMDIIFNMGMAFYRRSTRVLSPRSRNSDLKK